MEIQELEEWYGKLLRPAFGDAFRIEHDRDDFVTILLDGDREDFFFTLYGIPFACIGVMNASSLTPAGTP